MRFTSAAPCTWRVSFTAIDVDIRNFIYINIASFIISGIGMLMEKAFVIDIDIISFIYIDIANVIANVNDIGLVFLLIRLFISNFLS